MRTKGLGVYGTNHRRVWRQYNLNHSGKFGIEWIKTDDSFVVGGCMKIVIHEYAGVIVAFVGCICLLGLFATLFMGKNGFFAVMIKAVVLGGF